MSTHSWEDIRNAAIAMHCERIKSYRESLTASFTFGTPINVMLVSDTYYDCARELKELLDKSTDIKVFIKRIPLNAVQLIINHPLDFLIYVGPMQHEKGYRPTQFLHMLNQYSVAMMYAPKDELIEIEAYTSDSSYAYDLSAPIDTLITYMREAYARETELMKNSHVGIRSFKKLRAFAEYRDDRYKDEQSAIWQAWAEVDEDNENYDEELEMDGWEEWSNKGDWIDPIPNLDCGFARLSI